MRTLTMTFKLEAGGTKTYTLQDPAPGLTDAAVRTVMQKMIGQEGRFRRRGAGHGNQGSLYSHQRPRGTGVS